MKILTEGNSLHQTGSHHFLTSFCQNFPTASFTILSSDSFSGKNTRWCFTLFRYVLIPWLVFAFGKKYTVCIFLITWFVLFKINYLLSVFNAGVDILILNYSQRYPCRDITCVSYVKTLKQTFELSIKSDEHKFDK